MYLLPWVVSWERCCVFFGRKCVMRGGSFYVFVWQFTKGDGVEDMAVLVVARCHCAALCVRSVLGRCEAKHLGLGAVAPIGDKAVVLLI